MNDVYLDDYDQVSGTLTNTNSNSLSCWTLAKFTVENIEYYYERYGNPRLTEAEAITWDSSTGYSLKLFDLEYDWCNS